MKPWFIGYEAPSSRGMRGSLGERVDVDGDKLIRHAFVCGSTGAGKTVLAKGMVEEALLSGVPVVAIDLKGDLSSMALHEGLHGEDSLRHALGQEDAAHALQEFRDGIASQPAAKRRAREYARKVDVRVFTPKAPIARRLSMSAFPDVTGKQGDGVDESDRRALNQALVRGLASRIWGSRKVKNRTAEVTFLEELVWWAQENGRSLEGIKGLQELGRLVASPPLFEVGGMPIDDYINEKARTSLRRELAAQSAGANQDWFHGEPLRIDTLLKPNLDGRTPLSIIYVGHVVDFEDKALVIAKVCAEIFRWMRTQGGSNALKMLLYIDEIGGASGPTSYFPSYPYQPASKGPLGLLIRQGRAYGVGVLLATQNPMSVDVQALNNIGTWAVGKLNQTNEVKRLTSALSEIGMSHHRLQQQLSNIPTHTFLMAGEAMKRSMRVDERWLSTIHTVLTPNQLRHVHELSTARKPNGPRHQPEAEPAPWPPAPGTSSGIEDVVDPALPPEPPGNDSHAPDLAFPPAYPTIPTQPAGDETKVTLLPAGNVGAGAWWLIGPDDEYRLEDDGRYLVGRSSRCDMTFASDPYMSGRHAELTVRTSTVEIASLKSENPVKVNGEGVARASVTSDQLRSTTIVLGKTALQLVWKPD